MRHWRVGVGWAESAAEPVIFANCNWMEGRSPTRAATASALPMQYAFTDFGDGSGILGPCFRGGDPRYRGKFVDPIRNRSIACAHRRPSRIAHTTSDCPRRMSPAENTFGREVW